MVSISLYLGYLKGQLGGAGHVETLNIPYLTTWPRPPRTYYLGTGALKASRTYYLGTWGPRVGPSARVCMGFQGRPRRAPKNGAMSPNREHRQYGPKIMDPVLPILAYTLCFGILGHCFGRLGGLGTSKPKSGSLAAAAGSETPMPRGSM